MTYNWSFNKLCGCLKVEMKLVRPILFFFAALAYINGISSPSNTAVLDSLEVLINSGKQQGEALYNTTILFVDEAHNLINEEKIDPILPQRHQEYIQTILDWAKEEGTIKQLNRAQCYLLGFLDHNKKIKESIIVGNELLLTITNFSDEDQYLIYHILSKNYFKLGYYEKYLELIPIKYKVLRAFKDEQEVIQNEYYDLAILYYKMKQFERCRYFYRLLIQHFQATSSGLIKQASFYNNIAISFKLEGKTDSASYYYHKGLSLAQKSYHENANSQFSRAYKAHFINIIEADIAGLDKQLSSERLIYFLEKEAKSALAMNEAHIYLSAWNKLAQVYYMNHEYDLALTYLNKANSELKERAPSLIELYLQNLLLKSKVAIANKQIDKGEQLLNRIQTIKDSLEIEKGNKLTEIAAISYETAKKEKEIQQQQLILLEKNNKIDQQERLQLFFLLCTLLLLAILLTLYLFTRKLKKQKVLIERQKLLLSNSLHQKEILLKEVHHRVKNNLQVISGILHKQAQKSPDQKVKEMMEEGQSRIKSMAMIHQKLYQTKDFTNIDITSYIKELSNSISYSTSQQDTRVKLELNLCKTSFHIDIAIPLGLILNELLTNAYKYAFEGRSNGTISVIVKEKRTHLFEMIVRDNGMGLPQDIEQRANKSLGINLVKGLAWQLRGKLTYYTEHGSVFIISFTNQLHQS